MSTPKITVMIPTYNQSHFIVRAIRSALDQNYSNIEVIVGDDCSPDNTAEVVNEFIRTSGDDRVSYYRNDPNIGILRNYHRNLFDHAMGRWIVNLDADDFFVDRTFLSQAMAIADRNPEVSLIFADYCEYNETTGETIPIRNADHPAVMTDIDFFDRYADDRIVWNHNSIVYDRQVALEVGCYWAENALRNDWESFLRMTPGHKVARLNCMAAAWVQHGANETRRLDLTKYTNNFILIDGVADYALSRDMEPTFVEPWRTRMIAGSARSSAIAYIRARDYRGLAQFLRHVRQRERGLPRQLLTDPDLIARAVLASNAKLYATVKRLVRRRPPAR